MAVGCGGHSSHPDASVPDLATPVYPIGEGGVPIIPDMQRPFGPWVVFASNRSGNYDLYLVHPDGSDTNVLVDDPGDDLSPAWSPGGERVAFASNRTGSYQLYEVDILTGVVMTIPTGVTAATSPAYSPDGSMLAFGSDGISVVASTGGTATPLTNGTYRDNSPVWAPDGSVIYFSSDKSGSFDVWSIHPDGSALTQVTTGTNLLGGPAISPDNKTLAVAVSGTQTTILFWNIALKSQSTFSAMGDSDPSFATSGTQLAVTSTRYGIANPEVVLLGIPGATNPVRLTNNPAVDGQAAFQPVH